MSGDIHTCSYQCERPACIRAQRNELVAKLDAVTKDAELTQARYEHVRAWFLSGAMRTEILPHGHVKVYSEAEFDAAIDALTDQGRAGEGE